jgi:hypothetical protein
MNFYPMRGITRWQLFKLTIFARVIQPLILFRFWIQDRFFNTATEKEHQS